MSRWRQSNRKKRGGRSRLVMRAVVAVPVLPQRSLAATQLLDSVRLTRLLGAPIDGFGSFEVRRVPDGPCELQLRRGGEVLARKAAQVLGGGVDVGDWDVTGAERR